MLFQSTVPRETYSFSHLNDFGCSYSLICDVGWTSAAKSPNHNSFPTLLLFQNYSDGGTRMRNIFIGQKQEGIARFCFESWDRLLVYLRF